jgi:hypothetical protein
MNLNIKHKLFHKHVSHSYIVRRHRIIIVKLYVLVITTYHSFEIQSRQVIGLRVK